MEERSMKAARWDRLEVLFEQAQALAPTDRSAFLDAACIDPASRHDLERLLKAHGEAATFFELLHAALPSYPLFDEPGAEADPMIGRTISHYEVLEQLGEGGMGVVYKAHDQRLRRTVALKFLPAAWSRDPEARQRFLHGAQAASALDHPNICPVYDVDEADGRLFIAMACCEGETLKEKIARGPLPVEEAVDLARQMASGLAEAHAHGIVHRDLKPANVIVSPEGQARIVDFGIAKLTGVTQLTRPGAMMGTMAYMSPEQIRGNEVDHRTDIWALGVVLYEMLAGIRPFHYPHEPGLLHDICYTDPAPLSALRPDVPEPLTRVVAKCLAKEPEQRYQELNTFLKELRREPPAEVPKADTAEKARPAGPVRRRRKWIFGAAGVTLAAIVVALIWPPPSAYPLAVLPFTADSTSRALADGLFEDLTGKLTLFEQSGSGMWVVPSGEVQSAGVASPNEAKEKLRTRWVITGSVRRHRDSVDITVRLHDTKQLRRYDPVTVSGPFAGLRSLQDQVLFRLIEDLDLPVQSRDRERVAASGTDNPRAYELYLEGYGYYLKHESQDNLDRAISLLERAVANDRKFALAHALLGAAYLQKFDMTRDRRWIDAAVKSCSTAVELNELLPQVRVAMGTILEQTGRDEEAIREYEYARVLDPNNTSALRHLGRAYEALRQFPRAEALFREVVDRRPDDRFALNDLAVFLLNRGRFEEAAPLFQRIVDLQRESSLGYENLGVSYVYMGCWNDALPYFRKALALDPYYMIYLHLANVHFLEHRYAEAAATLDSALVLERNNYYVWGALGIVYHTWGEEKFPEAEDALRRALALLDTELEVNPNDPYFRADQAYYFALLGARDRAQTALARLDDSDLRTWETLYLVAETYERIGARDHALQWLERALEEGYPVVMLQYQDGLNDLRQTPEYQTLLQQFPAPESAMCSTSAT